jgi:hypothetical protein
LVHEYGDTSTTKNKGKKRRRIGGAGQGRDDAWQRREGRNGAQVYGSCTHASKSAQTHSTAVLFSEKDTILNLETSQTLLNFTRKKKTFVKFS